MPMTPCIICIRRSSLQLLRISLPLKQNVIHSSPASPIKTRNQHTYWKCMDQNMHKQYEIPTSEVFLKFMQFQKCLHRLNSRRTRKPEGVEKVNSPRRSHRGGMVGCPSVSYILELEKLTRISASPLATNISPCLNHPVHHHLDSCTENP